MAGEEAPVLEAWQRLPDEARKALGAALFLDGCDLVRHASALQRVAHRYAQTVRGKRLHDEIKRAVAHRLDGELLAQVGRTQHGRQRVIELAHHRGRHPGRAHHAVPLLRVKALEARLVQGRQILELQRHAPFTLITMHNLAIDAAHHGRQRRLVIQQLVRRRQSARHGHPDQQSAWSWCWLFLQKPSNSKGHAPIVLPLERPRFDKTWRAGKLKVERALQAAGCELKDFWPFPDHHPWDEATLTRLADRAAQYGAGLVTTEKDWARLPAVWRDRVTPWPVRAVFEDEAALDALLMRT